MASGDLSLAERLNRIETKLDILLVDVVALKVKAAFWGALAGAGLSIAIALVGRFL